jgi:hypothetical protein
MINLNDYYNIKLNTMNTLFPYVYCITNSITNEFYIGSRSANVKHKRTPEEDLLLFYHSSGVLKADILENPQNYTGTILYRFGDCDVVYWYEQLLIKSLISNPLCKNGKYVDPDSGNPKFSSKGKNWKLSEKTKQRMRKPKSEIHRKHAAESITGLKRASFSDEWKENLSKAALTRVKNIVECPHCNKSGSKRLMTRYHFENCKSLH